MDRCCYLNLQGSRHVYRTPRIMPFHKLITNFVYEHAERSQERDIATPGRSAMWCCVSLSAVIVTGWPGGCRCFMRQSCHAQGHDKWNTLNSQTFWDNLLPTSLPVPTCASGVPEATIFLLSRAWIAQSVSRLGYELDGPELECRQGKGFFCF